MRAPSTAGAGLVTAALLLAGCASEPPKPIEPVTLQGLTFSISEIDGFGNSVHADLKVVRIAGVAPDRVDLACIVLTLDGIRSEWTDHAGYTNAGQPLVFEPGATSLKVPVVFSFRQPLGIGGAEKGNLLELKVDCLRARTGFG